MSLTFFLNDVVSSSSSSRKSSSKSATKVGIACRSFYLSWDVFVYTGLVAITLGCLVEPCHVDLSRVSNGDTAIGPTNPISMPHPIAPSPRFEGLGGHGGGSTDTSPAGLKHQAFVLLYSLIEGCHEVRPEVAQASTLFHEEQGFRRGAAGGVSAIWSPCATTCKFFSRLLDRPH